MEVVLAQLAEDPRSVVLELEVVLGGGREFVTDAAEDQTSFATRAAHSTYMSNEYLWRAV